MDGEEVILIAVNQQDIASTNQADALRTMDAWTQRSPVENNPAYEFKHLRMLYLPNGLLFEDHLEKRWEAATGERVSEIIFPSRHVAASGQLPLTLHPIGVLTCRWRNKGRTVATAVKPSSIYSVSIVVENAAKQAPKDASSRISTFLWR